MKKNTIFLIFVLPVLFELYNADAYCGEVTIVYTANTAGKLRVCSCPGDPYGGLSERVTLVKELRQQEAPFLLVDAGNMVNVYGKVEVKASSVMRMMNLMKYDVAGAGRLEMYNGIEIAHKLGDMADFPILSTSFTRNETDELVYKPYVILPTNGQKVGIISVSDSTCFITVSSKKPEFSLLSLDSSLKPVLEKLAGKVDFIIALSHMASEGNKKLLAGYPQIDLVVQSHGNERFKSPVQTPHGILVAPGQRGQFVGLITLMKARKDSKPVIKRASLIPVLEIQEDEKAREIIVEQYKAMK